MLLDAPPPEILGSNGEMVRSQSFCHDDSGLLFTTRMSGQVERLCQRTEWYHAASGPQEALRITTPSSRGRQCSRWPSRARSQSTITRRANDCPHIWCRSGHKLFERVLIPLARGKKVRCRWLEKMKHGPDGPFVRSRLVPMEMAHGAGTSQMHQDHHLGLYDISVAFRHALLPHDEPTAMYPPRGER